VKDEGGSGTSDTVGACPVNAPNKWTRSFPIRAGRAWRGTDVGSYSSFDGSGIRCRSLRLDWLRNRNRPVACPWMQMPIGRACRELLQVAGYLRGVLVLITPRLQRQERRDCLLPIPLKTSLASFRYQYSPKIILRPGPADMAALQDFIAAVYAARLYIGILAVCAYGLSSYISYRRLAHIKGPFVAGWSNFWLVRTVYNLNTHYELYQVNKKYGTRVFYLTAM
jgi:hypothetical protein